MVTILETRKQIEKHIKDIEAHKQEKVLHLFDEALKTVVTAQLREIKKGLLSNTYLRTDMVRSVDTQLKTFINNETQE